MSNPFEADPNGTAGAIAAVSLAVGAISKGAIKEDEVTNVINGALALITVASIFYARVKAWKPSTVAALDPSTVGPAGELPTPPA